MLPQYFRSWDKENKKFYYYYLSETDCGYLIKEEISVDKFPTDQFTGVYDKNNNKIFNNDIIKINNIKGSCEFNSNPIGIVTWDDLDTRFYIKIDPEEHNIEKDLRLKPCVNKKSIEIISNIHEEPKYLRLINV